MSLIPVKTGIPSKTICLIEKYSNCAYGMYHYQTIDNIKKCEYCGSYYHAPSTKNCQNCGAPIKGEN